MPLPPFSFDQTVSAEGARQDKLEVKIQGGVFSGDADDAARFLEFVGIPPRHERTSTNLSPYGCLFVRPQRGEPPFYDQPIRTQSFSAGGQKFTAPLFAGHLEIGRMQGEAWNVDVLISLNPTRFVRHQSIPWGLNPTHTELPQSFGANHFKREIAESYDGEFALVAKDGKSDNWIPNGFTWDHCASKTHWPNHLRRCLTSLPQTVIDDLSRAGEMIDGASFGGSWTFNLRSVETYWEFVTNDPVGTVLALEGMLRMFSRRIPSARDYPCIVALDNYQNSRCLRLETRQGETLRIYAKTNRRIRFEISHLLYGRRPFRIATGGHTFPNAEGALPLLQTLASTAARRVNQVLAHFRSNASVPENQFTVLAFIGKVQAACESPEVAHEILQILTHNGSILAGSDDSIGKVYRPQLRRLVRNEVLQTSNGRYSVTPPFRKALNDMQLRGIGFLSGTRRRRRAS